MLPKKEAFLEQERLLFFRRCNSNKTSLLSLRRRLVARSDATALRIVQGVTPYSRAMVPSQVLTFFALTVPFSQR
jgi:hypothetical protein